MIKKDSIYTLLDFQQMMKQIKKEWWFDYGTALGAYRDKDFIKNDTDIDIGVYADDKMKLMLDGLNIMAHSVSYWKIEGFNNRYRYIKFGSHDKWDILVYYKLEKDSYYSIRKNVGPNKFACKKVPGKYLDKLETIKFKGIDVNVPGDTIKYLEYIYGKDWKTPKNENNLKECVIMEIEKQD